MIATFELAVTYSTSDGYRFKKRSLKRNVRLRTTPAVETFLIKKFFKSKDPERFDLKVAAIVRQVSEKNGKSHHLLLTKDLSNQGAYFNAIEDFAFVGPVEVEVVRRNATGLAVRFRGESSLKHLLFIDKLSGGTSLTDITFSLVGSNS